MRASMGISSSSLYKNLLVRERMESISTYLLVLAKDFGDITTYWLKFQSLFLGTIRQGLHDEIIRK